jgi:hypothetical protein
VKLGVMQKDGLIGPPGKRVARYAFGSRIRPTISSGSSDRASGRWPCRESAFHDTLWFVKPKGSEDVTMTIKDIAEDLVSGCRENRARANLDALYAANAVSVEAVDTGEGREAVGLDAIKAKHDWWESAMEVLDGEIRGPLLHGDDRFAVIFRMQVREKATGKVSEMEEVALYTVASDKIVREEFFY